MSDQYCKACTHSERSSGHKKKLRNKIGFEVPHKTIYSDIVDMPDPMLLGSTVHFHNYSDVTLYMQITGSGTGWSGSTVNLGSLGSGLSGFKNLDNFMSRAKPVAGLTETIMFTLKGYTDAGYTVLAYTFARNITVIMIKSDDGSWISDFTDNFDDGTLQGWAIAAVKAYSGGLTLAAAFDYCLSVPDSLKATGDVYTASPAADCGSGGYGTTGELIFKISKSFATPNKTTVYAILNIRCKSVQGSSAHNYFKNVIVKEDSNVLMQIGREFHCPTPYYYSADVDDLPVDKWMRVVVPLTANGTRSIQIHVDSLGFAFYAGEHAYVYLWLDDFRIISK